MVIIFSFVIIVPLKCQSESDTSNQTIVEITVDAIYKYVHQGQEAVFHWEIINNNSLYTVEITVEAYGDKTSFSQDHFILKPGESKKVDQHCPTLPQDEDGSEYTYTVSWGGTYYIGPAIKYTVPIGSQDLSVIIINENQTDQYNDGLPGLNNGQSPIYGWVSVSIIIFLGIISIVYWKILKKRKNK
jgi:hypothetical protein